MSKVKLPRNCGRYLDRGGSEMHEKTQGRIAGIAVLLPQRKSGNSVLVFSHGMAIVDRQSVKLGAFLALRIFR
jgi:hypothetical protein